METLKKVLMDHCQAGCDESECAYCENLDAEVKAVETWLKVESGK